MKKHLQAVSLFLAVAAGASGQTPGTGINLNHLTPAPPTGVSSPGPFTTEQAASRLPSASTPAARARAERAVDTAVRSPGPSAGRVPMT